ncbi:MAG: hypothetical protein K2P17_00775 [Helicobacteraceae bacterium]|nr:hypothetical protein [Helicobacteraceae bacterium]
MSRVFSIIFFGIIFAIFPLTLFYGGIFVNYFSFYGIKEYFNGFFMQNLNLIFYIILAIFSGIAFNVNTNILRYMYLILLFVLSSTFIPSVGKNVGDRIFLKNTRIILNGEQQNVKLIYKDKSKIYYSVVGSKEVIRMELKGK